MSNGQCDEVNNNTDCEFDGGDCAQACILPHLIADGFCDDVTNNEDCQFDGMDCCNPNSYHYYCIECICFNSTDEISTQTVPPYSTTTTILQEGNR